MSQGSDQTLDKQLQSDKQFTKKRQREDDFVATDNPLSPPTGKPLWSTYEKDGKRVSKPPLKKSKDDRPQVVLPESPVPLQAPSYSAASPPAPCGAYQAVDQLSNSFHIARINCAAAMT